MHFNRAPVTVSRVYHPCLSWPQKVALGCLLATTSTKASWQRERERCCAAVPPSCGAQAPVLPLNTSELVKAASAALQVRTWRRLVAPTPPSLVLDIATHSPQNGLGFCCPPRALLPVIATTHRHVSAGTCHLLGMFSSQAAASVAVPQRLRLQRFVL